MQATIKAFNYSYNHNTLVLTQRTAHYIEKLARRIQCRNVGSNLWKVTMKFGNENADKSAQKERVFQEKQTYFKFLRRRIKLLYRIMMLRKWQENMTETTQSVTSPTCLYRECCKSADHPNIYGLHLIIFCRELGWEMILLKSRKFCGR